MNTSWDTFDKYKIAFDYIIKHKPMHIVEYGGGQSTRFINDLLEELNYGGKITAYENNPEFYEISNSEDWNNKGSIKLVEVEYANETKEHLRYIHPLEEITDVDFVIIDGPDYRLYPDSIGRPSGVTVNLKDIVDFLGKEIPFFIDGRSGCVEYYESLNYHKNIQLYEV